MATDDGDGDASRRIRGIHLPRRDGSLEETYALGYADDLVGLLADEQQLVRFKELLAVYEQGSGAENDWAEKTAAIRVEAPLNHLQRCRSGMDRLSCNSSVVSR